jgi:hypothetical protein
MPDDGFRYELVRGELRRMPPAGDEHGYLALEIASDLRNHVKANNLGRTDAAETGFKLASDPDTVRAPDVAFVRRERAEKVGRVTGYWPGAPDLAVEVVSPNDTPCTGDREGPRVARRRLPDGAGRRSGAARHHGVPLTQRHPHPHQRSRRRYRRRRRGARLEAVYSGAVRLECAARRPKHPQEETPRRRHADREDGPYVRGRSGREDRAIAGVSTAAEERES